MFAIKDADGSVFAGWVESKHCPNGFFARWRYTTDESFNVRLYKKPVGEILDDLVSLQEEGYRPVVVSVGVLA